MDSLLLKMGAFILLAALVAAICWIGSRQDGSGHQPSVDVNQPARVVEALRRSMNEISPRDEEATVRTLAELKSMLFSLPPEVAADAIVKFLEKTNDDAATGLPFAIGGGGKLSSPTSLRVALLDWLGQIDPVKAGTLAEKILSTPTHPDEWAICLRNEAWANPGDAKLEYLRNKTEELIRNPEWRLSPSAGYLEAFDVLVHAKATASTRLLCELARDSSSAGKASAHAAFMTLDRLAIAQRAEMMDRLMDERESIAGREGMVAQIIARADVRNPAEKEALVRYLLEPGRTPVELDAFASVYPNANFMVSDNLLTVDNPPSSGDLIARDRAALVELDAWRGDPRFTRVKPWLDKIRPRLEKFAR